MRVYDRYVIKWFIFYSLLSVVAVIFLYDIINLFEHLSYFIHYKSSFVSILLYYFYDLPATFLLLYPVGFVLAVFFITTIMVKENTFSALVAGGINYIRIYMPFIFFTVISLIIVYFVEDKVAPRAYTSFIKTKYEKVERKTRVVNTRNYNIYFAGNDTTVYYFQWLDANGKAENVIIWIFKNKEIKRRIDIETLVFKKDKWEGRNVFVRGFNKNGFRLKKYKKKVISEIVDPPYIISRRIKETEEMSFKELKKYIDRRKKAGLSTTEEEVDLYYRLSSLAIVLVLVLMGIPLGFKVKRGGTTFGIGLGLLLSFIYWGLIQTSKAFGYRGSLSPLLAAWLPNIIYVMILIIIYIFFPPFKRRLFKGKGMFKPNSV